ncbi:apolipoprotein N-acyltransferase [Pseudolysinimonas sp.]|uniref:apolipoprotein N-acyltransferase n=1 Tax=Pseudolysinimonas sp. TaxID=2680009 RepID=UPI003783F5B1
MLPLLPALVVAAGAGLLLDTAFPDKGWWFTAFPAIGLALLAMQGRRVGAAILVGLVFGATFYWPHIEWASEFLGLVPWSALAAVMTLWNGAAAALIALAYRWVPRVWDGLAGRLLLLPVVVAGIWTAREAAASVWPYGGFSWGRVAFSQSDSPLSPLFAWLGVSGVSFAMVFLVAFAVAAVHEGLRHPGRGAALGALVTLAALVLVAVPPWTSLPGTAPASAPTLRVGAVQGDTKAGYFDPPDDFGDNLLGQVAATEPLYDEDVDVVVWPEGASDADPLRYGWARELWDEVSERADAPLVGGTITTRQLDKVDENGDPMPEYFNTVLLWEAGSGPTDTRVLDYYDKKHPVPFGEYVPDRAFWRQFAPDLIDLIQREYTPGTTDAVFELPGSGAIVGNAICFDIVDDQLLTEMVEQGAQIVFAETNNADFGRTDESVQQLAMARIRAIETARTVVNVSTVGTSAIVLPDGTIEIQLPWYEPGVMVADVPLLTTVTPAVVAGRQIEWLVSILGLGGVLIAGFAGTRKRAPAERTPFVRSSEA